MQRGSPGTKRASTSSARSQPAPHDPDGRSPAVVAWHDGELFFLIASGELPSDALVRIAESLY